MRSKILPSKPHFFQPLNPGFLSDFSIPKSFLKHVGVTEDEDEDENGENIVVLRDKRKINWYIKMVGHHFRDGWESFCREHNLEVYDFLVFKYHGQLMFDVFIYSSTSSCEREFASFDESRRVIASSSNFDANTWSHIPKKIKDIKKELGIMITLMRGKIEGKKKQQEEVNKAVVSNELVGFKPSGHPYWRAVNKPCYVTWGGMIIPKAFARENELAERWCDMVLIDENGKSWSMTLRHTKTSHTTYIGGWRHFHQAVGLNIGDHLVFELLLNGEKPVIKFHRNQMGALEEGKAIIS